MEPVLMEFLNRYFAANREAALAIEALSSSYEGVAQYVNMFAEWLIVLGDQPTSVQELIETHLENIIVKNFDPQKADRIFASEGGTPTWLSELIGHKHWRRMIYTLVDTYRDCLFLNFTVKLISDAGFQVGSVHVTCRRNRCFLFRMKSLRQPRLLIRWRFS